jgi:hypothetical protein
MLFKEPIFVERQDSQNDFKSKLFKIIVCNTSNFNYRILDKIKSSVDQTFFEDKSIVEVKIEQDLFILDCYYMPEME